MSTRKQEVNVMGISIEKVSGRGQKRPVDKEINLIPMIDFLLCCVAFLLITAVWSRTESLPLSHSGSGHGDCPSGQDKTLHVELTDSEHIRLSWKAGRTVLTETELERRPAEMKAENDGSLRYNDLGSRISEEWSLNGSHKNPTDRFLDHAVLHTRPDTSFGEMIAVIDAIYTPKRRVPGAETAVSAFRVTFAKD